ncbi:hypothetical protein BS78_06G042100 [Paspalum vaginatum]|nr:hypothetical protein BS78_06G042100 [Paspalum vaginatum]
MFGLWCGVCCLLGLPLECGCVETTAIKDLCIIVVLSNNQSGDMDVNGNLYSYV